LPGERMVRQFQVADDVLLAAGELGEDSRQQNNL
jgi:hypothetical protein